MDRIDIHIDVHRVKPGHVISTQRGTSSATLREGVMKARSYSSWRRSYETFEPTTQGLMESCHLADNDLLFLEEAAQANHMSGRAIVRTVSVARTIADMDERLNVTCDDLCEALGLRLREGVGE